MPDDLVHDQDITLLRDEISGYQQMFVELHKESEKVGSIDRCGAIPSL